MYGRVHVRDPGEVLNPDLEPLNKLSELPEAMGEYAFEAQYQQHPGPLQGDLLKVRCFHFFDSEPSVRSGDMVVQR